jgi:hypothetical protein
VCAAGEEEDEEEAEGEKKVCEVRHTHSRSHVNMCICVYVCVQEKKIRKPITRAHCQCGFIASNTAASSFRRMVGAIHTDKYHG